MIAIVDYGAGNLFSVKNACAFLSLEATVTNDPAVIEQAQGIILPGVGAFPDAMKKLHQSNLVSVLTEEAKRKPFLGICLGMQMLFEYSSEFEDTKGLSFIPGSVNRMETNGLKLPQIGWNDLSIDQPSVLLEGIHEGDYVYFVHSYAATCEKQYILASSRYGCVVPALVGSGQIFGTQFHPEKSGDVGLRILKNFGRLVVG